MSTRMQAGLSHTLYRAMSNQRSHDVDPTLFTVFWQGKQADFGSAAAFNKANEELGWFVQELGARIGVHARGYSLTSSARAIGEAYLLRSFNSGARTQPQPDTLCTTVLEFEVGLENANKKPFRMLHNAISSKTSTGGNSRFTDVSLSPIVVIDVAAVTEFYENAISLPEPDDNGEGKAAYDRAQRAATQALMMLDIVARFGSGNVLPSTYVEVGSGRLYAVGSLTLQGCTRELRKAALKGCFDIDIDNCHWAILEHLATDLRINIPHISSYLIDKQRIRSEIARDLEISVPDAKSVLLQLLYGSPLAQSGRFHTNSIELLIGKSSLMKACKNRTVIEIYEDIKAARRGILASCKATSKKRGYLTNDAGRQLKLNGSKPGERLAHILQGAESEILHVCLGALDNIVVIQHDGFSCKDRIDVDALSSLVIEKTGYQVKFSQKRL